MSWIKLALLVPVVASTASCVVEERGRRGRTVVEERREPEHGRGHAYGHEKHGR